MAEIITREEIAMWRGHLFGLLPHQTFAMPRATLDIILDAAEASLSHPAAMEAECARKDEALRQIADPRNWEEQDRARSIARAALGPWRPTHQHYSGATVRVLMRISNKFVIYDFGPAGDIAPVAVTTAEFDGPAVKQNATVPRYRPLTPDEQDAYVEAAMGGRTKRGVGY